MTKKESEKAVAGSGKGRMAQNNSIGAREADTPQHKLGGGSARKPKAGGHDMRRRKAPRDEASKNEIEVNDVINAREAGTRRRKLEGDDTPTTIVSNQGTER